MPVLNYNCTSLGDHEKISCNNWKKGGSSAIAIIESDYTVTDWTSASDWNTDITGGKITLVESIKAMMPESSVVEGENPIGAGPDNILDSLDQTITYKDFNVTADNIDFYNALNERRFYVAFYHDVDSEVTVNVSYPCVAQARLVTPESKKEKRHFLVTITWTGIDLPPVYTAPTGVFNAD